MYKNGTMGVKTSFASHPAHWRCRAREHCRRWTGRPVSPAGWHRWWPPCWQSGCWWGSTLDCSWCPFPGAPSTGRARGGRERTGFWHNKDDWRKKDRRGSCVSTLMRHALNAVLKRVSQSTFLLSGELWLLFLSPPSSSACRGSLPPNGALAGTDSWLLALHPVRSTPAAHHSYT